MRQRRIKNLDEKMEYLADLIVDSPEDAKGKWRELYAPGQKPDDERVPLFAEIGCGKGKFIRDMALAHPDRLYAAFEGNQSVVYHAMQKADESGLANVRFVTDYIDMMDEFFDDGELDGIYLNFSDPWP